jgi:hypothetical protein
MCRRCRQAFLLPPGEPLADLCSTCRRHAGTRFTQAAHANHIYQFSKQFGRSAESGRSLNAFERNSTSISLKGK